MIPYADYSYYVAAYRGKMPQCDFERLAGRASTYLDSVTFQRLRTGWAEDDRVREACCAIADVYFLEEHGGGVASETNDGISVTYVAGARAAQAKPVAQQLWETAVMYLGTPKPALSGGALMLGCKVPVTLVRHISDKDGDRYECAPVLDVSWFRKEVIAVSVDGAKPVNTCVCRIPADSLDIAPKTGDYLVRGAVQGVTRAPQDFGALDYMQITSVGDNRRGGLPHWRVSGS